MRILFIDIENTPHLGYIWGLWDQNVSLSQLVEVAETLCFAAKWLGEDEVYFASLQTHSKKKMLKLAHKLLDEADAVVHYNGNRHDIPHLNRGFIEIGLTPPSPFKQIDLLNTAKRQFKFPSNKLEYVAKALGVGEKMKNSGFELWTRCMKDDPEAWKEMQQYNIQDVIVLEAVYNKLLPWIKAHANHSVYSDGTEHVCPNCGGKHLQKRGFYYTLSSVFQRFKCNSCGHWSKDNKVLNRKQHKLTSIQL